MRRPIVAGNWKMHGSQALNRALLGELEGQVKPEWPIDVVVFPPFVYLTDTVRTLEEGHILVGAQDVCAESGGAFTGQVSAAMLKDVGCTFVIVGHSERRRWYHEDDSLVARKFAAAVSGGLRPVLCVGETLEEREANMTEAVVGRQIDAVIALHGIAGFAEAVLAYEPVWAIGTGLTPTLEQIEEIHLAVAEALRGVVGEAASRTPILYGGSVKPSNAAEILKTPGVGGALVGGASLKAADFLGIIRAV
jgi:triosephosphate isomerase